MVAVLTDVAFVVPAAFTLLTSRKGNLDDSDLAVITGKQFGPGFSPELQLGYQKPVPEAIHVVIAFVLEPVKRRLELGGARIDSDGRLKRCA